MASDEPVDFNRLGRDIVSQLAGIIRNSQIHDPSNVAVTSAVDKFMGMVNPVVESEGAMKLEVVGEFFFLNDSRIKYSMEYLTNFEYLIKEFKGHSLGSMMFKSEVSSAEMLAFIKAFLASTFNEDPFRALSEAADAAGIHSFEIGVLRHVKEDDEEIDVRRNVKKTYYNAVSFTKGVMNRVGTGEKINVKKAKRVVETLVDHILEQEELVVGMTAIKDYDEYTYHHSVNVSILSVALGQRLGLSKKSLMELGMVSLFHDLGKTDIPPDVLNKPGKFTPDEWMVMKRHPVYGVSAILKMKGIDATSIKAAIVAYEHHIHSDDTGYPETRDLSELDLFSKIVSIADQYDAMTSARVYARTPLPPDKALQLMVKRTGPQLEPLLMKFFINMVGVFPAGTLVLMDTRELGLVYSANHEFPDRPKAVLIMDKNGKRLEEGTIADLTEKDANDAYIRSIVKTLDASKYKINLADYML